jgi:hypothetical protein
VTPGAKLPTELIDAVGERHLCRFAIKFVLQSDVHGFSQPAPLEARHFARQSVGFFILDVESHPSILSPLDVYSMECIRLSRTLQSEAVVGCEAPRHAINRATFILYL